MHCHRNSDVDFEFRVQPGQTGVDITVIGSNNPFSWTRAEIKPNTASGFKTFNTQVRNWGYGPGDVHAITYDGNGFVRDGFLY
jgi:hypothetical protein